MALASPAAVLAVLIRANVREIPASLRDVNQRLGATPSVEPWALMLHKPSPRRSR